MADPLEDTAELLAATLRGAGRVAFLTGAGLSAESGLPTYRGMGGLYNGMTRDEGRPIEDILSGATFAQSPALTWKYLREIERACRGAAPNAAHRLIAALEALCEVRVITQNVDGLHQAAGSSQIIELHGRLRELHCTRCRWRESAENFDGFTLPPRCGECGGVMRPNVVLFGEMLPLASVARYERELAKGFDMIFTVGTTAGFPYIHDPVVEATRRGIITVEINPDHTPLSGRVAHRMACGAVRALQAIGARLGLAPANLEI